MFPFDQQSETRADLLKLMEIALENATRGVLPIALRLELRDIVSLLVYQAYQYRHQGEPEQKAISDTAEALTNLLNKLTRRKRGNDLKTVDAILNLPEAAQNILLMDTALAFRKDIHHFTEIDFGKEQHQKLLDLAIRNSLKKLINPQGRPINNQIDAFFNALTELFKRATGKAPDVSNHYSGLPKTYFEQLVFYGFQLVNHGASYHTALKAYRRAMKRGI